MKHFQDDVSFEVRWLPFQLNPQASKTGISKVPITRSQTTSPCVLVVLESLRPLTPLPFYKVKMYQDKFGKSEQEVFEMAERMKANFAAAGLPYVFTHDGLTGNTFNAHRLLTWAGQKSLETQDQVAEALFRSYFAEEKFPNDPEVLVAAAVEAGLDVAEARAFVEDESALAEETTKELHISRLYQVRGVPFFVLSEGEGDDAKKLALSGAQPPAQFVEALNQLSQE